MRDLKDICSGIDHLIDDRKGGDENEEKTRKRQEVLAQMMHIRRKVRGASAEMLEVLSSIDNLLGK